MSRYKSLEALARPDWTPLKNFNAQMLGGVQNNPYAQNLGNVGQDDAPIKFLYAAIREKLEREANKP